MEKTILLHGSEKIVQYPSYGEGKPHNDYGKGFYCTMETELACEWACKNNRNGFVNSYEWQAEDMRILHLEDPSHTVLNWIAVLLKNRTFRLNSEIAVQAREYLISHFAVDTGKYDAIVGYRADDSYFQYAQAFVENSLPLRALGEALRLGNLGLQIALVSERAFDRLTFLRAEPVDHKEYYRRFRERDETARREYREIVSKRFSLRDDVFVLDILREEMKADDARLQ